MIAVIAILAAILFPSSPRARGGPQTVCASDLRQIGFMAIKMVVQDNDGYCFLHHIYDADVTANGPVISLEPEAVDGACSRPS